MKYVVLLFLLCSCSPDLIEFDPSDQMCPHGTSCLYRPEVGCRTMMVGKSLHRSCERYKEFGFFQCEENHVARTCNCQCICPSFYERCKP